MVSIGIIFAVVALVALSALFSGLTLGLMGLDGCEFESPLEVEDVIVGFWNDGRVSRYVGRHNEIAGWDILRRSRAQVGVKVANVPSGI